MILALKRSAPSLYNAPIVCSCTQLANNEETRQLVMLLNTPMPRRLLRPGQHNPPATGMNWEAPPPGFT